MAGDETAMFRSLVHHSPALTMLLDSEGCVSSASGALARALGLDPEQVEGHRLSRIVHAEDREALDVVLAGGATASVEVRLVNGDGEAVPYELTVVNLVDDPVVAGYVVSGHDISRLRDAQSKLEELANRDSLTGLPNRACLDRHLTEALARVQAGGESVVVAFVDLDRFKPVNDRYGHDTGDQLLCLVAARLRSAVREDDLVARFGGDEFVVVTRLRADEAPLLAERIERVMSEPFAVTAGETRVSASVGWAVALPSHTSASILSEADARMYVTKRARPVLRAVDGSPRYRSRPR